MQKLCPLEALMIKLVHRQPKYYTLEAFVDWMSPRREEHELRTLVVEQIRRAVRKVYPTADVTAFGSYETILYLPSG